jgi:hypothetical protein
MAKSRRDFLTMTSLAVLGAAAASRILAQNTSNLPAGAPPAFGAGPAFGPEVSTTTFEEAEKLVQFSNAESLIVVTEAGIVKVPVNPLQPLNALDADGTQRLAGLIDQHRLNGGSVLAASHQALPGDWRRLELSA